MEKQTESSREPLKAFFLPAIKRSQNEICESRWCLTEGRYTALTGPFSNVWMMVERVPGLPERAEHKVFWHKHRVQLWWRGAVNRLHPDVLLCWSDCAWSLLCYWARILLNWPEGLISEKFPLLLTSKPEVIKEIRVIRRGASKPLHICMLIPQTVSLLYDLFAWPFYNAWVNEFIAHMVHQHSLRPLNKLQCPLVPYETCCSLLALNLSHIALLCFYWMCFFKAVVACLSTISSNGSTSSFMEVYTGLHPSCYSLNNLSMLFHNKMATLMFLPYPQYLTKPGTFLLCSCWLRHHTVWL